MRKILGMIILVVSFAACCYLVVFSRTSIAFRNLTINKQQFEEIISHRSEAGGLLDTLVFEEETLFFDQKSNTFYYSLAEGNSEANNPQVKIEAKKEDLAVAFLTDGITEENIKNDRAIQGIAYTGCEYNIFYLKCTTLPIIKIECQDIDDPGDIADIPVKMNMTVFDNRIGAARKVTVSEGEIHVRGATTREYPKKSYGFSLVQESMGGHMRANDISLLGMRQDDDWILYAAYNDQEKIRNVFSCNLWQYTCATDNSYGINTGVEYKYLELFMNGEYWGLYALGYSVGKKQLQLDVENGKDALYKVTEWTDSKPADLTSGNMYEARGTKEGEENWSLLSDYYRRLLLFPKDNKGLYAGIDIDNAIDIYLFFNLIQGSDNVSDHLVKNLFVAIRDERQRGLTAIYCPWDMDISWGNCWQGQAVNCTVPYGISPDKNCVMESGYLNQLLLNGEEHIWESIFDKYRYLRLNLWTEEQINSMLDEYEADIYESGAYLRDMERWPDGSYADAAQGLSVFRAYVMRRLQETDAYYKRLETLSSESVFIRRSAEYKNFRNNRFILEINDKELLNDSDYIDFLEFIGVDIALITEDIHFVIGNFRGVCDYLSSLTGNLDDRETSVGKISFLYLREGVTNVFLDGMPCYESSIFSKPGIKMSVIEATGVEEFHFIKDYASLSQNSTLSDLSVYMEALAATRYHAVIEINNPDMLQSAPYLEVFKCLGISEEDITQATELIVWDGINKTSNILNDFHTAVNGRDTVIGGLSLSEEESGIYRIYLNGTELFVSSCEERESRDIRILLLDSQTHEIVEGIWWAY